MSEAQHDPAGKDHDDPTAGTTAIVGAISVILLLVSVFALEALYYRTVERERVRKFVAGGEYELHQLQAEQLERISEYRIVDPAEGKVTIPVERAMELLIEEDRRGAAPISPASR